MKKKLLTFLMSSAVVFGLAACGGGGDDAAETDNGGETTTASAGDPQKLYEQKCSSCHAIDLSGGVGPELTKIGSALSKEEIETVILEGKGTMPRGLLKGAEATAVADWLAEKK